MLQAILYTLRDINKQVVKNQKYSTAEKLYQIVVHLVSVSSSACCKH